ncbi:MAG: hypothetical protein WD969_01920 [Paracoccaceae bacterium]
MAIRIRIPWLLDLVLVSAPGEILTAANDPALDRAFRPGRGPLVNRVIARRLDRGLRAGGVSLPSARRREDPERRAASGALAARLDPAGAPWDEAALDALASHVRGEGRRPAGELAQEAIGRLFAPAYCADAETWRAALLIDASLKSNNPLRRLIWWVTGAIARAQARLAAAVDGDPSGVHATGVAVHSFLRAVESLRHALADRERTRSLTDRGVLGRALTAPDMVARVAVMDARIGDVAVDEGVLVILQTSGAAALCADRRVVFLSTSWSACPASALAPVMLAQIWERATNASKRTGDHP